jgi:hypothetical protein
MKKKTKLVAFPSRSVGILSGESADKKNFGINE